MSYLFSNVIKKFPLLQKFPPSDMIETCAGEDSNVHIAICSNELASNQLISANWFASVQYLSLLVTEGGFGHHLDNASSKIGAQIVFYILNGIDTPKSSLAAGWRTVGLWGWVSQVQLSVQPSLCPAIFFLSSRLVKSGDSPTNAKEYGQIYKCRFIAWRITLHSNAELYSGIQSWMHCWCAEVNLPFWGMECKL